jgi:hypothetical protein
MRNIYSFIPETSRKDTTRRPRYRRRKNVKYSVKKKDVDFIHPTKDRDQWPALLNAVPKLWVPQNRRISSLAERL